LHLRGELEDGGEEAREVVVLIDKGRNCCCNPRRGPVINMGKTINLSFFGVV
jgi:hypothetical protein